MKLILLLVCASLGVARAEDRVVDGGLVVAMPAALPTGMSLGVGLGVGVGRDLAWGARASWASATEYTLDWTVRHDDLRLRLSTALQHTAGRGTMALRLAAGATAVHETRTRSQGGRAGLTGDELETSSWALLPAADLEAAVGLRIAGDWSLVVSGGPSLTLVDGGVRGGWIAGLGVAWHD